MGFVREVFTLLTIQIGFTALVAGAIFAKRNDPKVAKLLANPAFLFSAMAGFFASYCALVCCEVDKKVPTNYILLFIFTLCQAIMVGHACARVPDPSVVLAAACMTFAAVACIMTYACCTKEDYTVCGPSLFMAFGVFAVT